MCLSPPFISTIFPENAHVGSFCTKFQMHWAGRRHFLTKLTKNVNDNVILVSGIDKLLCVKYTTWARTFNVVFFHENFFLIIFCCPPEAESLLSVWDQGALVSCKCPKEITFLLHPLFQRYLLFYTPCSCALSS